MTHESITFLWQINGGLHKSNDVLFRGQLREKWKNVIFFGGDIQDVEYLMRSHPRNKEFCHWSLEKVSEILQQRFPCSNTWIIKPSKMIMNTISVFSNFVKSDSQGVPEYLENTGAIRHLYKLLYNCCIQMASDEVSERVAERILAQPIVLVGFSKGCVVLNQIVCELSASRDCSDFISRFESFYWLDGGHQGSSGTWLTDENILRRLVELNVNIEAHVTPYQVRDIFRKWIGEEEAQFAKVMTKISSRFKEVLHFSDEEPSIENHFSVLLKF